MTGVEEPSVHAGTAEPLSAAGRRGRALKLAAFSSLISKGVNALIMLISVPLALQIMGAERYGVFSAVQSILWITCLCDLGIGASVVRGIADAEANGDTARQSLVMSTAFRLICQVMAAAALLTAVLLWLVPGWRIFGAEFQPWESELKSSLWLALGIFSIAVPLTLVERAREGLQQTHVSNLLGAIMNLFVCAGLLLFVPRWPGVVTLLLCFYGIGLVFSLINASMLAAARPSLRPVWSSWDGGVARQLLRDGTVFFIAGTIAPVVVREGVKLMISHEGGPTLLTHYAVLIQLGFFATGLVTMITRPLWAAAADASARGESAWLLAARARCLRLFVPLAACGLIIAVLAGPWLLDVWLHRHIEITRTELAAFSISLGLGLWSLIHYTILAGSGRCRGLGILFGLETLLILILSFMGVRMLGLAGAFGGMAIGTAAVSTWLLPLLIRRRIGGRED